MYWIYILKLKNERVYVGETTQLISRLNEHVNESSEAEAEGCSELARHFEPQSIVALYKIDNNIDYYSSLGCSFDRLDIVNMITENMMETYGCEWWKVLGGKYDKIIYDKPKRCKPDTNCDICWYIDNERRCMINLEEVHDDIHILGTTIKPNLEDILKRPPCKCGFPCEIGSYDYDRWQWSCSMRTNNYGRWIEDNRELLLDNINKGCNFLKDI